MKDSIWLAGYHAKLYTLSLMTRPPLSPPDRYGVRLFYRRLRPPSHSAWPWYSAMDFLPPPAYRTN